MDGLIKYCKSEHNIQGSCNTIQLGTFDYYREMNPKFSIADAKEGFIHYKVSEDIDVTAEQYNAFLGSAVAIKGPGIMEQQKHPGGSKIRMQGGGVVFDGEKTKATVGAGSEVELYYPNSYMFCSSIYSNGDEKEPKIVSEEYDSYYQIDRNSINSFATSIATLLEQQLKLGDFKIENQLKSESVNHLRSGFKVTWIARPVEYIQEKEIYLKSKEDFDLNKYYEIYFDSMFKKGIDYASDMEFRILFFVQSPTLGIQSMNKSPKILELNPIKQHLK